MDKQLKFRIIDISWHMDSKMTSYKNQASKKPSIRKIKTHKKDSSEESQILFNSHTGTHVDAPRHFFEKGKTIDEVSLKDLSGNAKIFEIRKNTITEKELESLRIKKNDIIIFKTKNSQRKETEKFDRNFAYLDKTGAEFLARKKIKAVGIDYLGIERNQKGHETHKILLNSGIPIIEGLRLRNVKPGEYFLVAAPLYIEADASPARVFLVEFKH